MDRCALFVDAGYLLADGAMAVHGTRHREAVSWDFPGLLQVLGETARDSTGLPLLRCYWYESTVEARRSAEHDALADLPGLKLRLGRIRPGRREGVDTQVYRDVATLAKAGGICDAVLVTGDEDMVPTISEVQDLGVRVVVVHVPVDSEVGMSRTLRQECDDLVEIGVGRLRPLVRLLAGVESVPPDAEPVAMPLQAPLSNGHAKGHGRGTHAAAPMQTGPHSGPPPGVYNSTPQPLPAPLPAPAPEAAPQIRPAPPQATAAPPITPPTNPPMRPETGYRPPFPQQNHGNNPYTGPPTPPAVAPAPREGVGLPDAVNAAHREGREFGDSVAREAPALWLEAVLARKPRMPSDLEARLLQGSSLPIDFLLHDEVRHALRRGFWDALENSRQ